MEGLSLHGLITVRDSMHLDLQLTGEIHLSCEAARYSCQTLGTVEIPNDCLEKGLQNAGMRLLVTAFDHVEQRFILSLAKGLIGVRLSLQKLSDL